MVPENHCQCGEHRVRDGQPCPAPGCGRMYREPRQDGMKCNECGGWVDFTDLGSVAYHEHKGLNEPWGIKGTPVCYLCHEPLSEHEAGAHDVCLGKLAHTDGSD